MVSFLLLSPRCLFITWFSGVLQTDGSSQELVTTSADSLSFSYTFSGWQFDCSTECSSGLRWLNYLNLWPMTHRIRESALKSVKQSRQEIPSDWPAHHQDGGDLLVYDCKCLHDEPGTCWEQMEMYWWIITLNLNSSKMGNSYEVLNIKLPILLMCEQSGPSEWTYDVSCRGVGRESVSFTSFCCLSSSFMRISLASALAALFAASLTSAWGADKERHTVI